MKGVCNTITNNAALIIVLSKRYLSKAVSVRLIYFEIFRDYNILSKTTEMVNKIKAKRQLTQFNRINNLRKSAAIDDKF